jgi:sigma-B regulation protein RsbU (phosphoserine phosphatase)
MATQRHISPPSSADEGEGLRQENDRLKRRLAASEEENRSLREELTASRSDIDAQCAERQRASEALKLAELIIDSSPAVLFRRLAADDYEDRQMVYVSPNIFRFGYRAEDFLQGRLMFRDILYPGDRERIVAEIDGYVARGVENYTQTYRIVTRSGDVRWIEDRTSVVEDPHTGIRYHQGIVIDIHERKEAEEKLRRSEEKYRRIVETAGEGFLLMDEGLRIRDVNSACCRMARLIRHRIIGRRFPDMIAERYRYFFSDGGEDLLDGEYHEFECDLLAGDGRTVPVIVHLNALKDDAGGVIGIMAFVTDITEHKKALSLAGEVQRSLLPQGGLKVAGLDVAGRNVSCDEIGGDYFDFFWDGADPAGPFAAVVGDISGHGVDSALLMTSARAFLRLQASRTGRIADIVTAMNRQMADDVRETGRFMTLFYLAVSPDRNRIEWVRAGHDPAWIYDPAGDRFRELKGPGIALGIDRRLAYRSNRKTGLEAGQVIVLGTDGIWEGRNTAGEMYGKNRLRKVIRRHARADAETILDAVFREHAEFTRGAQTLDDVTLVILKRVT